VDLLQLPDEILLMILLFTAPPIIIWDHVVDSEMDDFIDQHLWVLSAWHWEEDVKSICIRFQRLVNSIHLKYVPNSGGKVMVMDRSQSFEIRELSDIMNSKPVVFR
jgi:hypothetical protein